MTQPKYPVPEFGDLLATLPRADDLKARVAWLRSGAADTEPPTKTVHVDEWSIASPDADVGVLGLRVYVPEVSGPKPALLYCHGGAFAVNDLEINNGLCRDLAIGAGCVVVAVDYRLSPENRYPAAFDDCYQALEWVAELAPQIEVDPDRVAVGGASAGGALAAAVAIAARDRKGPHVRFLHLVNPILDDRMNTASAKAFTDSPMLTRETIAATWANYLPDDGKADLFAAPGRLKDFTGLPPAYIEVAQYDPLRDEGIAFATGLLAAGIEVELHLLPGTFHGSEMLRIADVSRRARTTREGALRRALLSS